MNFRPAPTLASSALDRKPVAMLALWLQFLGSGSADSSGWVSGYEERPGQAGPAFSFLRNAAGTLASSALSYAYLRRR